MQGRRFWPRRFCVRPGRARRACRGRGWRRGQNGQATLLVVDQEEPAGGKGRHVAGTARGGPRPPSSVRFTDPSGTVIAGAAARPSPALGRAVSEGVRGFTLEFTLL